MLGLGNGGRGNSDEGEKSQEEMAHEGTSSKSTRRDVACYVSSRHQQPASGGKALPATSLRQTEKCSRVSAGPAEHGWRGARNPPEPESQRPKPALSPATHSAFRHPTNWQRTAASLLRSWGAEWTGGGAAAALVWIATCRVSPGKATFSKRLAAILAAKR